MIKWEATIEECDKIAEVIERAESMNLVLDRMTSCMDLEAVHCNDVELDFDKLIALSDDDFKHDFVGIRTFVDRKNGKLMWNFLPKCAKVTDDSQNTEDKS